MRSDLEALRFVDRADVYKGDRLAGALVRGPDGVAFTYDEDYLAAGGEPVATTLPVRAEPHAAPAGAVPPFFAGLLPEGRRLIALRQAVKTSADDELSLLLAVGRDVVGDVQVVPQGELPGQSQEDSLAVDSWETVRLAELFARSSGVDVERIGIPGVQEKVSARMMAVPVARRGARYILKLNPPEFPHVVENEAFFLQAARASGLAVTDAEVVRDAVGESGLLVRRFDRVPLPDGQTMALAQEDGCQVLGRYPADKYSVTAEEMSRALIAVTRAKPVAARDLLRQLAFAYLSCNGDAHAKNFSVLRSADGEWRVSPAYDLPSSYPYGDHTMALSVADRRREDITRQSVQELGRAVGLNDRAVGATLDALLERSEAWIDRLDELPFDERTVHKLRKAVLYRRDRLSR